MERGVCARPSLLFFQYFSIPLPFSLTPSFSSSFTSLPSPICHIFTIPLSYLFLSPFHPPFTFSFHLPTLSSLYFLSSSPSPILIPICSVHPTVFTHITMSFFFLYFFFISSSPLSLFFFYSFHISTPLTPLCPIRL